VANKIDNHPCAGSLRAGQDGPVCYSNTSPPGLQQDQRSL
jgi:hypothetical protein